MVTINAVRLLGAAELGALLGVSRARVTQLMAKPWFPEPIARLKLGGIWELADIERMASQTGRTLDYAALDALSADPDSLLPGDSSSGTAGTAVQREP
jgi:predicted DNA-binding transcriptional regulator AlpA